MNNADKVLAILAGHQGRHNAITAPQITTELGWSDAREREVRAVIEEHANVIWGGLLCAVPGLGYFFAGTIEEIATYRALLDSLAATAREKVRRFDAAIKREGVSLKEVA